MRRERCICGSLTNGPILLIDWIPDQARLWAGAILIIGICYASCESQGHFALTLFRCSRCGVEDASRGVMCVAGIRIRSIVWHSGKVSLFSRAVCRGGRQLIE